MADVNAAFVNSVFGSDALDDRKKKVGLLNSYGVLKAKEFWDSDNRVLTEQFNSNMLDRLLASYTTIWDSLNSTPDNVDISSAYMGNNDINEWNAVDMLIYSGKLTITPTGNPLPSAPILIMEDTITDTTTEAQVILPYHCTDYRGIHYNNVYIYNLTTIRTNSYVDMYDPTEPLTTEALVNSYISYLHGRDIHEMKNHGKHIARAIVSCDYLQNVLSDILTKKNNAFTKEDLLNISNFTSGEMTLSVPFDNVVTIPHIRMETIYGNFKLSNLFNMVLFTKGIFFPEDALANKLTDNQFDSDIIINSKYTDKYILNSRNELLFRNFYDFKPDEPFDVICIKETRDYKGKDIDGYVLYSPYNIPITLPKTNIEPVGGGQA